MADKRDRIKKFIEYLKSLGISVNIGKTKARGNKGIYIYKSGIFRIDVSKDISEDEILSVLLHEFSHYIHYQHDKKMQSLEFVFGDLTETECEELINVTVNDISKTFASSLFEKKEKIKSTINELAAFIRKKYPDFIISQKYQPIEKQLNLVQKYLLKYDNVKIFNKIYSTSSLKENFTNLNPETEAYIKLKSLQRKQKRVTGKINRLNRYYNSPTELFARFIDSYYTNHIYTYTIAPSLSAKMEKAKNEYLKNLSKIFNLHS